MANKMMALLLFCFISIKGASQDTIKITQQNLNTNVLKEGTHRYLVYFKMSKDSVRSNTSFWTRSVKRIEYKGLPAVEIMQEWEDKDSINHTSYSVSDANTFKPLYHKSWWKVPESRLATTKTVSETVVDVLNNTIQFNGKLLSDLDTGKREKAIWAGYTSSIDKFYLNWHLDLETFPLLPYKLNRTFVIPFYDPGTSSNYTEVSYTVTASTTLDDYNGKKIDSWLLVHEEKGNKETFWISKKTREVLKLEQEINGKIFRYKLKLAFSN